MKAITSKLVEVRLCVPIGVVRVSDNPDIPAKRIALDSDLPTLANSSSFEQLANTVATAATAKIFPIFIFLKF